MNIKKLLCTGTMLTVALTGCATDPSKMQGSYASPNQYKTADCQQIKEEMARVEMRKAELEATLKKKATMDKVQMAAGALLFWPALLFLEGGDGPEAVEYKRLKGEYEVMQSVAKEKQCDRLVVVK